MLQYERGRDAARLDPLRFVLLLLAIPGAAALLLPFSWGISPWEGIQDWKEFPREITIGRGIRASGLALLGSPFLLAWGVAGLRVRLLVRLRMRWPEGVVALSLAGLSALCTIVVSMILLADSGQDDQTVLATCSALVGIVAGGCLVFFLRRRLAWPGIGVIAMQSAFLANAVMCLIGLWGGGNIGYHVTAVAAAVSLLDIARTAAQSLRRS